MIIKNYILYNEKLIEQKFVIEKNNDMIIVDITNKSYNNIKIPMINNVNGIYYEPITFPIKMLIYDNKIFYPYYLLNNENILELDFFLNIKKIIISKFNLKFYSLNMKNLYFEKLINKYSEIINKDNNLICLWKKILIKKIFFIYHLNDKITNNSIFKINNIDNYLEIENSNELLNLNKIKTNSYYEFINSIIASNNLIENISKIEKKNIFKIFINYEFNYNIFSLFFKNNKINIDYVINYYFLNSTLDEELYLRSFLNDSSFTNEYEINILKSKNYNYKYLIYLNKKYYNNKLIIKKILVILFDNYIFPLKNNKIEITIEFDYLMYYSITNYEYIINNNIDDIIPIKVKNLYKNITKLLYEIINSKIDFLLYNKKFYFDYLHKNVLSIYLFSELSNNISVKYFRDNVKKNILENIKNLYHDVNKIINFINILKIDNLNRYVKYFNIFLQTKANYRYNIIMSNNLDFRIKEIMINPLKLFQYLDNIENFNIYTKFIIDKIYICNINIKDDDIKTISKIIFLFFKIKYQKINDENYDNFIDYCSKYHNLIIYDNKINLKIKNLIENENIKINLGILYKNIIQKVNDLYLENNKN